MAERCDGIKSVKTFRSLFYSSGIKYILLMCLICSDLLIPS